MKEKKSDELINRFKQSETVKALDRYFSEKSMMEILGVDRDENAHSNFLAWLFENSDTCDIAVRRLVETLISKEQNSEKQKILENFLSKEISAFQVNREERIISKDANGKVDIVLRVDCKTGQLYYSYTQD